MIPMLLGVATSQDLPKKIEILYGCSKALLILKQPQKNLQKRF